MEDNWGGGGGVIVKKTCLGGGIYTVGDWLGVRVVCINNKVWVDGRGVGAGA